MTDTTDRELMQQALNDLETLGAYIKGGCFGNDFMQVPSIEALRERLAQSEQEPVALLSTGIDVLGGDWNKFALAAAAILKETK